MTLCTVGNRYGATWGPDDTIVFASGDAPGLMQVPAAGGEPRPLTEPEADEGRHSWPAFVPGGNAVLYTHLNATFDTLVAVVSLDTGAHQTLVQGTAGSVAASGHLVFAREASLWAVPFDPDRLTVSGAPAPMVEDVQVNPDDWAHYALADDGTLVYLPSTGSSTEQRLLVWVDRSTGAEMPLAAPPRAYRYPRISPDGTRVALDIADQQQDVWIWNLAGETLTRLTLDSAVDAIGAWTPDGERVIFASFRGPSGARLFWKAADGTGRAEPLGESEWPRFPMAVAPDGSVVVVVEIVRLNVNLMTVSLTGEPVSEDLVVTEFVEQNAALSPDGAWVAYQSDRSGQFEIYVQPFPDVEGGLRQVSTAGGTRPVWGPDGSELLYLDLASRRMMAAPVQTEPTFTSGTPEAGVDESYFANAGSRGRTFDIAADGRFLMIKEQASAGDTASTAEITVVLNWFEELTARVPVP